MTNEELNQAYAEQLANRRAANCYDIHEAAQAIAAQLGLDEYRTEKLRDDMGQAAFNGALTVRSPGGHDQYAPTSPPKTTYGFDALTTPDDVNKWATDRKFAWRWLSEPVVVPACEPSKMHLVADPKELIKAFGNFTGMSKAWFNKLGDKPELKAAQYRDGKSGRKGHAPLFYVYPVVLWLIDEKRKAGTPMRVETGWRMFKTHFPKAYEVYQEHDPQTFDRG